MTQTHTIRLNLTMTTDDHTIERQDMIDLVVGWLDAEQDKGLPVASTPRAKPVWVFSYEIDDDKNEP